MLKKNEGNLNRNDVILADCIEGLQKIPRVQVQHYFREANKCTDALLARGALLSQDFVFYQSPPADVVLLVSLDAVSILYERFCSPISFSWLIKILHAYLKIYIYIYIFIY